MRQIGTVIEFTHRISSGIAMLMVAGLLYWAFRVYPRGHRVRSGAVLSGIFIGSEALIGAGLVLLHHVAQNQSTERAYSLTIHLINTFTLLAVLALTAWWASGGAPVSLWDRSKPRWLMGLSLAGLILLGISGAIAALGDTLFPVKSLAAGFSADFSPTAHLFVRLRVFHPGIAVLAIGFVLFAVGRTMKQMKTPVIQNLGLTVMGLSFLQLMLGAINLGLLAPVPMQLIHLFAADLVWIATVLFAAAVL